MILTRKNKVLLIAVVVLTALRPLAAQSELLKLEAVASYYGAEFDGRPTSSGELFNMKDFTAAHKTLPFGTMLEVTNLQNGKKVTVRVNDRGPFVENRELDVSKAAAETLGMIATGTAKVSIRKMTGAVPAPAAVTPAAPETTITVARTREGEIASSYTVSDAGTGTSQTLPAAAVPAPASSPAFSSANGGSWRIQLGSFTKEENATRLAIRLRQDGFDPSFEKTATLIRVVLTGIADPALSGVKGKLGNAGYTDFIARREAW